MIKAIIFDWGGTLYDTKIKAFYPGAVEVVKYLAKRYRLALLSVCKDENRAERHQLIRQNGLHRCFKRVLLVPDAAAKFEGYAQVCEGLNVRPHEVAIVDDRVIRGIMWGNHHGAYTVWACQGEHAHELPNDQTGLPRRTILHVMDLLGEF